MCNAKPGYNWGKCRVTRRIGGLAKGHIVREDRRPWGGAMGLNAGCNRGFSFSKCLTERKDPSVRAPPSAQCRQEGLINFRIEGHFGVRPTILILNRGKPSHAFLPRMARFVAVGNGFGADNRYPKRRGHFQVLFCGALLHVGEATKPGGTNGRRQFESQRQSSAVRLSKSGDSRRAPRVA